MTTLIAVSIDFSVKLFTITSNVRLFKQSFVYLCGFEKKKFASNFSVADKTTIQQFSLLIFFLYFFVLIINCDIRQIETVGLDQEGANTQTRQWLKNIFETFVDSFIPQHQLF